MVDDVGSFNRFPDNMMALQGVACSSCKQVAQDMCT